MPRAFTGSKTRRGLWPNKQQASPLVCDDAYMEQLTVVVTFESITSATHYGSPRRTSRVKSTWPGVSMMLMQCSFQKQVVAAEVIVMPRSRSCAVCSGRDPQVVSC